MEIANQGRGELSSMVHLSQLGLSLVNSALES